MSVTKNVVNSLVLATLLEEKLNLKGSYLLNSMLIY